MKKKHSQYPKNTRIQCPCGSMTYRGVTITSYFQCERNSWPESESYCVKWYSNGSIATPSLVALLNSIDYNFSDTGPTTERLTALPAGECVWTGGRRYLKTDVQHEHEGPGNWFVDLLTGKAKHAGDLAAMLCGWTPRPVNGYTVKII